MRALTLWRPWSDAIVHGPKRVENRPWTPPDSMIGELIAIHSGKRYDADAWMMGTGYTPPEEQDSPTGIVGVARIIGWLRRGEGDFHAMHAPPGLEDRIANLHHDPWWCGPCGWLLDDVVAIDPIPHPGALGLWHVPGEKVELMMRALGVGVLP